MIGQSFLLQIKWVVHYGQPIWFVSQNNQCIREHWRAVLLPTEFVHNANE